MRLMSEIDKPAPCPQCGTAGERLVSTFASKVGFYVRAPSRPAFRQSSGENVSKTTGKKATKGKSSQAKTTSKGGKK